MPGGSAEYAGWIRCLCWLAMLSGNADYFLYAVSLCWLDGYASNTDCLAMLAKPAGCLCWLYWLAILCSVAGNFGCGRWLPMLYMLAGYAGLCLIMPANHASWLPNLAFLPGFLCWPSCLAAGNACCVGWLAGWLC